MAILMEMAAQRIKKLLNLKHKIEISALTEFKSSICTTITVMSSVRVSYCNQRRYDSATIAAQASRGSLYFAT